MTVAVNTEELQAPGRAGRRVTWVGVGTNGALIALKRAGGICGHSQALVADAVHSMSDFFTDAVVLFGLHIGRKPADDDHPHGHGRIRGSSGYSHPSRMLHTAAAPGRGRVPGTALEGPREGALLRESEQPADLGQGDPGVVEVEPGPLQADIVQQLTEGCTFSLLTTLQGLGAQPKVVGHHLEGGGTAFQLSADAPADQPAERLALLRHAFQQQPGVVTGSVGRDRPRPAGHLHRDPSRSRRRPWRGWPH